MLVVIAWVGPHHNTELGTGIPCTSFLPTFHQPLFPSEKEAAEAGPSVNLLLLSLHEQQDTHPSILQGTEQSLLLSSTTTFMRELKNKVDSHRDQIHAGHWFCEQAQLSPR